MTFSFTRREKRLWWLGDGLSRVTLDERVFWALRRAEALPDGRARIDGVVVELRRVGPVTGGEAQLWDVQGKCPFIP